MKTQLARGVTLFAALIIFFTSSLKAQDYLDPKDFRVFNLGFKIGFNYNSYNLLDQINIEDRGVLLKQIELQNSPGVTLGMITNFKLTNFLSLRIIPSISLEQRNIDFTFAKRSNGGEADSVVNRKIEAAYLNVPMLLQWKSKLASRMRFYVLTGAQVGFNLASNKRVLDDQDLLKIKTEDFSLVFGVGLNLYGDKIKLSPEITYTLGLTNIFVPENTTHSLAISRLSSQVLSLNFNFE